MTGSEGERALDPLFLWVRVPWGIRQSRWGQDGDAQVHARPLL